VNDGGYTWHYYHSLTSKVFLLYFWLMD
jgi:hypothetical protein